MAAPFQWSLAALETLMAEDQMDQHAAVLRAFSVVELWRLRRVCRAFHRWGTAALAALPRVVVVGGQTGNSEGEETAALPWVPQLAAYCLHLALGDAWNKVFFGQQKVRYAACYFASSRRWRRGGRWIEIGLPMRRNTSAMR